MQEMLDHQESIKGTMNKAHDDVELTVIAQSYTKFKDEFKNFQDQVKNDKHDELDAWIKKLDVGVKLDKKPYSCLLFK